MRAIIYNLSGYTVIQIVASNGYYNSKSTEDKFFYWFLLIDWHIQILTHGLIRSVTHKCKAHIPKVPQKTRLGNDRSNTGLTLFGCSLGYFFTSLESSLTLSITQGIYFKYKETVF